MSTGAHQTTVSAGDPLIDEVRAVRRDICNQFGNDVDRLFEHLREVQRDYVARRGVFAAVTKEAAARVAESWGDQARQTNDPIIDEVRAIRNELTDKKP